MASIFIGFGINRGCVNTYTLRMNGLRSSSIASLSTYVRKKMKSKPEPKNNILFLFITVLQGTYLLMFQKYNYYNKRYNVMYNEYMDIWIYYDNAFKY